MLIRAENQSTRHRRLPPNSRRSQKSSSPRNFRFTDLFPQVSDFFTIETCSRQPDVSDADSSL